MASAYSVYRRGAAADGSQHTVTALSRWSVLSKTLPAVDTIKALHVYDFDNTLFKTPLPNPALWNGWTMGLLATQAAFSNGGWWHDNRILAATGQGLEKEEPRAWEGWWNEKVVELARLSMKQPDALCVLLTGRSEKGFASLVKSMVAAKKLDFDMVSLKPQVSPTNQPLQSTMHFKQLFLDVLMETYSNAAELRIYEDRPRHTAGFRRFFVEYNRRQATAPTRGPIAAEVIQVANTATTLDPVTEVAEVQRMINLHNAEIARQPTHPRPNRLQIKRAVSFTAYMISTEDSRRLFRLAQVPPDVARHGLKAQANRILICPRQCPASILDKVGGMGSKLLWQVTAVGCYDDSVWAATVRPVLYTAVYHTDSPDPIVILASRRYARTVDEAIISRWTQWQHPPTGQSFVFETTVGEKAMLRVEEEDAREDDEYEPVLATKPLKRKHAGDEGRATTMAATTTTKGSAHGSRSGGRNESRGCHSSSRGGSGPRGRANAGGRGSRGSSTRGGRAKGPGAHYRSLDDVEPKNQHGGYGPQVTYDDVYSQQRPQPQGAPPPTGPKAFHGRGGARGQGRSFGRGRGGGGADLQNYY